MRLAARADDVTKVKRLQAWLRHKNLSSALPEIRLAQRLIERRGLCPPIDVESILNEYATVQYVEFPVQIDGLCLGLKAVGMKPTVLLNKHSHLTRRRFTLAHELGHVLIPWHIGSIIDEIDVTGFSDDNYYAIEVEANRFASELLMPSDWVKAQIISCENPLDALFQIFPTWQPYRCRRLD